MKGVAAEKYDNTDTGWLYHHNHLMWVNGNDQDISDWLQKTSSQSILVTRLLFSTSVQHFSLTVANIPNYHSKQSPPYLSPSTIISSWLPRTVRPRFQPTGRSESPTHQVAVRVFLAANVNPAVSTQPPRLVGHHSIRLALVPLMLWTWDAYQWFRFLVVTEPQKRQHISWYWWFNFPTCWTSTVPNQVLRQAL